MASYIISGRFQPLHNGHIDIFEKVKMKYPEDLLIICIIRKSNNSLVAQQTSAFHRESIKKQEPDNNPLPNWNRYMLVSKAIKSNPILMNNTEILFRDRADINWEKSLEDLPEDRIWVFPQNIREEFDIEKQKYYIAKNEKIEIVDNTLSDFFGMNIRDSLRNGNLDLSFLPDSCRDYFIEECLHFFIK